MVIGQIRRVFSRFIPGSSLEEHAATNGNGEHLNTVLTSIPLDERLYNRTDEYSFILKPSRLQGVGVFVTHGIAAGTLLAMFPKNRQRFISNRKVKNDPRLTAFCEVYGVKTQRGYFVASSFGCMPAGWYLNHSDEPNAHHLNWDYFASRDIAADEEITIDYRKL